MVHIGLTIRTALVIGLAVASVGLAATPTPKETGADKLYEKTCQSCHGVDGKGVAKMAKMLKVELAALNLVDADTQKDTDAHLTKEIADGVNKKMPAYGKKFTGEQIKNLVAYLRCLAAPRVAAK